MSNKTDFKAQLKNIDTDTLSLRIGEDTVRLKKLQFSHAISPIENPTSIRLLRRDLARQKTELQSRKLSNKSTI